MKSYKCYTRLSAEHRTVQAAEGLIEKGADVDTVFLALFHAISQSCNMRKQSFFRLSLLS